MTRSDVLAVQLERDPLTADVLPRVATMIDYALKLTRAPDTVTPQVIENLRAAGLSDAAIHDVAAVTAYFNFVNRIALGLGVDLEAGFDNASVG